jgi:hypothetical protein
MGAAMFKRLLALCVAALLAGCSLAAAVLVTLPPLPNLETQLVVGTPTVPLAANSPLNQRVQVNNVSDGQDRRPRLTSAAVRVFPQALQLSLSAQGILGHAGAAYSLDAAVLEVKEPFGFSTTVTSTVSYMVKEVVTGRIIFDKTITADSTAKFGDHPSLSRREPLAFVGSLSNNISKFLDQLIAMFGDSGIGP